MNSSHVEDATGFDNIERWTALVDASEDCADPEGTHGGIECVRLNIES